MTTEELKEEIEKINPNEHWDVTDWNEVQTKGLCPICIKLGMLKAELKGRQEATQDFIKKEIEFLRKLLEPLSETQRYSMIFSKVERLEEELKQKWKKK